MFSALGTHFCRPESPRVGSRGWCVRGSPVLCAVESLLKFMLQVWCISNFDNLEVGAQSATPLPHGLSLVQIRAVPKRADSVFFGLGTALQF